MKRRSFLLSLGAVLGASTIPFKHPSPEVPWRKILHTAKRVDNFYGIHGFAVAVSDSSKTFRGLNVRTYPPLVAKLN